LLLVTGVADTISTIYFMTQTGAENEALPAIRFVSMFLGPIIGPIIGKICQYLAILAVTVFFRKQAVFIFIPVIVLYGWAAWYNIWGSQIYYPRLLHFIELLS
jgi:tetrahydromethanopterin S-methyltransferase subunit D